MGTIKQIVNKSFLGTIGYIGDENDLQLLESYILHNQKFFSEFKNIVVATNYGDLQLEEQNINLWKKYYPKSIHITSKTNRGPAFGTADLDNAVFDYCKKNNIEWLCKSANDVVIQESLLDKEIPEADFYYLNGFSYEDLYLNHFDYGKLFENRLFPQTNFYILNVSKTDYLTDKEYLNSTYDTIKNIPNYNNKPWEYIDGWGCELFLKDCVERNNLTKHYLLDKKQHDKLCAAIQIYKIGDPSHKNIIVEGICHFQHPEQQVIVI